MVGLLPSCHRVGSFGNIVRVYRDSTSMVGPLEVVRFNYMFIEYKVGAAMYGDLVFCFTSFCISIGGI